MTRITAGLEYLAGQFSASRHEFARDNQPQGDMLADGLVSLGYALETDRRLAISRMGNRVLEAKSPEMTQ